MANRRFKLFLFEKLCEIFKYEHFGQGVWSVTMCCDVIITCYSGQCRLLSLCLVLCLALCLVLCLAVRTTISYYTYITPYSLGRKYTYKIEKHPRIIFNGMYVPRGAFSQSFRALAAKDQKLWLTAD